MREPARERSATFGVQRFEPVFKTHETLARSRQRLDAFVMDPVQQEIVNGILKARTKGSDGFKIVADQPEESSSSSQKFGDIFYYDVASGALVLTSQDAPVACVAFNIYDKASLLDIRQIQGVQGRQMI